MSALVCPKRRLKGTNRSDVHQLFTFIPTRASYDIFQTNRRRSCVNTKENLNTKRWPIKSCCYLSSKGHVIKTERRFFSCLFASAQTSPHNVFSTISSMICFLRSTLYNLSRKRTTIETSNYSLTLALKSFCIHITSCN